MALASLQDINVHLPDDKLEVQTERYPGYQQDAERLIRGYLSGYVSPTTLSSWTDPDHTPEIIRACAGRLVAAFVYRKLYSEDSLDDPQYAQLKYNEAMAILQGIILGTIVLEDVTIEGGEHLTETDYYPNDGAPGPYFKMVQEL